MRVLAVALAVAAMAAGCGGGGAMSKADYAAKVRNTRDRVDFALARITQAQSHDELLDRMTEAATFIDRAADDLDKAGAAKGFEDETKTLVAALRQLSTDLAATAEQAREPGFQDLLSGATGLSFESWTRANRALQRLRQEGIDVQPLARH